MAADAPEGAAARARAPCTAARRGTKLANAVTEPIIQTATYTFADTAELVDHFEGRIEREEYGRYGNPTQRVAEHKLAALEGAEDGLLFSSGMAAITTTLFAMLSKGAHVVVTDDAYRRTRQFLQQVLRRYGVEVTRRAGRRLRPPGRGGAPDDAPDLQRVADQSLQPHPRPRARRRDRPPPPGQDGHRFDLRDARSTSVRSSSASISSSTPPPSTSAATTTCSPAPSSAAPT